MADKIRKKHVPNLLDNPPVKTATIEVKEPRKLFIYADPEFAACMWQEVESDPYAADCDDVTTVDMQPGDIFVAEWLGFEMVDHDMITNVKLVHESSHGKPVKMSYEGWILRDQINFHKLIPIEEIKTH